jgi:hypothetical protein
LEGAQAYERAGGETEMKVSGLIKRKMYKKLPFVEVEWIDAVDRKFTGTVGDAVLRGQLAHRFQGGYLVHRDEKVLVLAQTWDPPDDDHEEPTVDTLTVIPADWVVKLSIRGGGRRKPDERPAKPAPPDNTKSPGE